MKVAVSAISVWAMPYKSETKPDEASRPTDLVLASRRRSEIAAAGTRPSAWVWNPYDTSYAS